MLLWVHSYLEYFPGKDNVLLKIKRLSIISVCGLMIDVCYEAEGHSAGGGRELSGDLVLACRGGVLPKLISTSVFLSPNLFPCEQQPPFLLLTTVEPFLPGRVSWGHKSERAAVMLLMPR